MDGFVKNVKHAVILYIIILLLIIEKRFVKHFLPENNMCWDTQQYSFDKISSNIFELKYVKMFLIPPLIRCHLRVHCH